METFDQMNDRVKRECAADAIDEAWRTTGTACEPKRQRRVAGQRYCIPCDTWMRRKVCKACGLETEPAAKEGAQS